MWRQLVSKPPTASNAPRSTSRLAVAARRANACVARARSVWLGLVHDLGAGAPRDLGGAIGRRVVDDDDLEQRALERLRVETREQRRQRALAVADGDDHADLRARAG